MTATQSPPLTETADRFRCAADIPDPPPDAAGRKLYWEDTVAEAVAELRRRLASNYDEKSFEALQMILDLEKTRIRHKEPVAGTKAAGRFDHGLGSLEDSTYTGGKYQGPKKKAEDLAPPPATRDRDASREGEAPAEPPTTPAARQEPRPPAPDPTPRPNGCGAAENAVPLNTPSPERGGGRGVGSSAWSPKPARPIPLRERVKLQDGIHGHFHDHDDDYLLERGRGRRKRERKPKPEEPEEFDWEAFFKAMALLPSSPRRRPLSDDVCFLTLRDAAPDTEPAVVVPDDDGPPKLSGGWW